ncbi:MAG: hypothetical protein A2508_02660 [Candidatus Lambdaproteobacteria bacterium RIFOXYD12_FULL_49_8]|uniref:HTH merR-type domain-containing protein n=1 Tax=Candidatus Lambdaproteobacteria bacterium RIFOXYD2_FULL_50_16 TaxID=1817772 RepID=A0A1F6GG06_9PROT|nr:MAG: hypothetical protein A2527_02930 [Candidatus Lambdaproteobacteria bacterium RIFOXYD2_FULL_50_16]OGG97388.1 MAG: hypothetical protein A2508_02660 [Candidatus Lambdaproteobacteria bacterium RIFOXYD12_FULL_49_8]
MAKAAKGGEMLSAGKVAQALETTPAKVKKAIETLGLEPSSVKGGCSYYDEAAVKKIKAAIK